MLTTIHTEIEPLEYRPCPPLPLDGPLLLKYDCPSVEFQHINGSMSLSSLSPSLSASGVCSLLSDLPVSPLSTSSCDLMSSEHLESGSTSITAATMVDFFPFHRLDTSPQTASPQPQTSNVAAYLSVLLDILCAAQTVILCLFGYADGISTSRFPLICSTVGALLGVWPTVMALRGFYVLCATSGALRG
ncbi:hypothetical protein C8J57DRAFT_1713600, partial [Mycena rebaudengoi]